MTQRRRSVPGSEPAVVRLPDCVGRGRMRRGGRLPFRPATPPAAAPTSTRP